MIKKLKQLFARFRAWQRNPFHSKPMAREVHHCLNCGQDFEGNFCPSCGQKANVGRLGWKSVMEKVFDVWDMEKGSLPTTLWHLLWRPGYMICDYLDGKRRHYYSPVMLVFILGVVDAIVESLVETPSFHEPSHSVSTSITAFQQWCEQNEGWSYVIHDFALLLPTWLLFRYSPRHPRHTLPEAFFILAFISALLQFLEILGDSFGTVFKVLQLLFVPVIILFCYGPVFGYGIWGTLWRFFLCLLSAVEIILLTGFSLDFIMDKPFSTTVFFQLLILGGITFVMLAASILIGWFGERRRRKADSGSRTVDTGWKTQFIESNESD